MRRAKWWLFEPRGGGAEAFDVSSSVNFFQEGVQSLANVRFQRSQSLRS